MDALQCIRNELIINRSVLTVGIMLRAINQGYYSSSPTDK